MHICLTTYRGNPYSGGQGVYIRTLCQALLRRGHQVDVISGPPYPHLPDAVKLVRLPSLDLHATQNRLAQWDWRYLRSATTIAEFASTWSGGFPEPWLFGKRLLRWWDEHPEQVSRYDVVHDNQGLFRALLALQDCNVPLFNTLHHPVRRDLELQLEHADGWGARVLLRRWYRFLRMQEGVAPELHRVASVSQAAAQDLTACFGLNLEDIKVIPNGVDTRKYERPPNIQPQARRLFSLASTDAPYKGLAFLLSAVAALHRSGDYPGLELVLLCNLNPSSTLPQRIADMGLSGVVKLVQGLKEAEVVAHYCAAEVVVVASVYEGFGLPLVEAMGCGSAVVTTSGGALKEVADDAAEVVAPADAQALERGLRKVLDNPDYAEQLRQRALQRIVEHYSLERMGERYEDWYMQGLAR